MKKRILSILLTLCMVICLVPVSVLADDTALRSVAVQNIGPNEAAVANDLYEKMSVQVSVIKLINDIELGGCLSIDYEVTIDLNGHVLKMADDSSGSVIKITKDGHLILTDGNPGAQHKFTPNADDLWVLDETGGTKTVNGGVIYGGTGTAMYYYTYGGGVLIEDGGQFTMNGGSIVGCSADSGGGVKVECGDANGTFTMNGGAIIGCVADSGGGVETDSGGEGEYGIFAMNGGVIDSCVAADGMGGGVYASGPFTMGKDAAITNCKATEEGSGVFLGSSTSPHTLNGTITSEDTNDGDYIFANNAQVTIGANANIHANITLEGGTIEMNANATFTGTATVNGGSMYTTVATANDFTTALKNSGVSTIRLTDDITLPRQSNSMIIRDGRQLILDLNGYVLDLGANTGISVGGNTGGIMTIMDSRPDAPHKFTPDDDGLWAWDETGGTETVLGGVITCSGSAIHAGGSGGKVIMDGGNIVGCRAGDGGAVSITGGGQFTMNAGSIVGCYASGKGGGVYLLTGTFELAGGVIKSCKAGSGGGGVYVGNAAGIFTMTGGSIEGCTAANGGALRLYGTMNANGGTVDGTVVLDTKVNSGITHTGIIQGNSNATLFNGDVNNAGEIKYGTFNGTVTFGNSTFNGKITGGTFNGPVTTDSEGEAAIGGGVFNGIVTINRGKVTNGTFNKNVVVDNARASSCCTTLTGGTYNGLIINKSAYAAFAGAHSPLGIVETKPSSTYSNDQYRTVTFDLAGGNMDYPVRYFFEDGNISGEIKPAPRTGYTFGGWYKADGTAWNYASDRVTGDITLYAKWTPHTFTVTFDSAGGSEVITKTMDVTYGEPLGDMPVPIRLGYFFCGWYDALAGGKCYGNSEGKSTSQYDKTENCTLYAQWKINQYTITFDTAGGSKIDSITQDYGTTITAPVNPTREGYKFTGWDKEIPETMPAENITIKARWEDIEKPTGEIKISENSWKSFLNNITFGLFFKDTQTVTVTAADNSGEAVKIEYLLSAKELTETELASASFTAYTAPLSIDPDNEYIIYVRLTDKAGNTNYICSDGIVLDGTSPVITGIENGKTYCEAQTVTINENYIDTVTVNGTPITLDENNSFVLDSSVGEQKITVTDKAGNSTEMTVTVNDGHTFGGWASNGDGTHTRKCTVDGCDGIETKDCSGGKATCAEKAVCEICGKAYGELDANNHADLKHIEAKAATKDAEGNIEYWYCEGCGKYYSDAEGTKEITKADTVTAKLPDEPKSPRTGDNSNVMMWFALLFVSGGAVIGTTVVSKQKKRAAK